MKKSRIMLFGASAVVFLALLTLIIFFRVSADKFISFANNPDLIVEPSGIVETREFSYRDFDQVHFESIWDVIITEDDNYSISIKADKALLDELDITKTGKTVNFSYEKFLKGSSRNSGDFKVYITMPELRIIEFTGMGNVELLDFSIDQLDIINSGASNIEAKNVSIEQLNLIINGAANAELSNIDVVNCHLDISGAANIELHMTGGELTGQISGAASVAYSGSVTSESVSISGIGSLERR